MAESIKDLVYFMGTSSEIIIIAPLGSDTCTPANGKKRDAN